MPRPNWPNAIARRETCRRARSRWRAHAPPKRCDTARRREVIAESRVLGVPADYGRARRMGAVREPAVLELEELLSARLDTRVSVSIGSRRGRIVVEFADLDDLERIYRIITPPGATITE